MSKQIFIQQTKIIKTYCYMGLMGAYLLPSIGFAEPAIMQPVGDIHFQELPPPWFSDLGGKAVVPAASIKKPPVATKPAIKQARPAPVYKPKPANYTTNSSTQPSSVQTLIATAKRGDRQAQYDLGMRYQYGNGVQKSRSKAHRWLNKSAEAGKPQAQYALSLFYQQYARNQQGIKKALLWLKKAADQGLADAQYSLGMMFKNGSLVHNNPTEARRWLQMAAAQGHVAAQLAMQ